MSLIAPRTRRWALGLVLAAQTLFFFVLLHRPIEVESDNVRYELPAYNLVHGRNLSLPYIQAPDPEVRGWVCGLHPSACLPDTSYPVALYAPGYSLFIASLYVVFGRSLVAILAAQLVLLWLLFILFERMAAQRLDRVGYRFAMGVAATYPFFAQQAGRIMSDHLHVVLLVAALAAHLTMRPGVRRGAFFGGLMAAATLTRPYSLLVLPVLWLWPSVWRAAQAGWRERLVAAAVFLLPFAAWSARNAYWYHRFVPITTAGVGLTLYHTTMEFDGTNAYEVPEERYYNEIYDRYGDPLGSAASRAVGQEAIKRIKARPGKMLARMIAHAPKLWISLGASGHGLSRAWPLLLTYLGGLWLLGLAGMLLSWRDPRWHVLILTIVLYWGLLVPLPAEARRTLPLRLPHLLFAGVAVSAAWSRWQARRSAPRQQAAA